MNNFDAVDLVLKFAPRDLTITQRLVLIQIAYHQPRAYQRVSTLAAELGIRQEETVRKAVRVLVERGLISVETRKGRTNVYKITVAKTPMVQQESYGQTGAHPTRQTGGHPMEQTGVKQIKKQITLTNQDFEDFWSVYPRKEARKKAEQVFMLIPNVSIDTLLTATRAYRDAVDGRELKFVKLACNWLEQESWLDQVDSGDDWMSRALND